MSSPALRPPVDPRPAADRVRDVIQAWRGGESPDAPAALAADPDLRAHPSLVLDLAYEEFCLREAAGQPPALSRFCARFDTLRAEIRDVLEGHQVLTGRPDLLGGSAPWPEAGDAWGDLRFLRELGRGAFARVYLAEDGGIGRPVVLKLARRASPEGRSLGKVRHPHVADVLWSRTVEGFHVVAMPFEAAATLRRAIDVAFAGGAPPRRADAFLRVADQDAAALPARPALVSRRERYAAAVLAVAERLADALASAQSHGVAHGDLKPANVLIAPGGHPFLIDFNLAAAAGDPHGRIGGTVAYASPERLRLMLNPAGAGGDGEADDVYSFGVILYECLTGRLPFDVAAVGGDVSAAISRAIEGRRNVVPTASGLSREVSKLVRECLTAPERRPRFREVAARLGRFRRRRRRIRVAGGLVVGLGGLLGTGLAFGMPVREAPPAEELPKPPTAAAEFMARGRVFLEQGQRAAALADFERAAKLNPDGRTLATLAYVLAVSGNAEEAAQKGDAALKVSGFREPWAVNNYAAAVAAVSHRKKSADMGRVVALAAEAVSGLKASPGSRSALYNLAMAEFWVDRNEKGMLTSVRCLAHIKMALDATPPNGALSLDAACLYAAAGEPYATPAFQHAADAIRLGHDRAAVVGHPHLARRLGDRALNDLEGVTQGLLTPQADLRWISPFVEGL